MSNIDWDNAPLTATHYGGGTYWRQAGFCWMKYIRGEFHPVTGSDNPFGFRDYSVHPQPQQNAPAIAREASNKYSRQIVGLDGKTCQIDVYRVLAAFEVDSHPVAYAIKKLLAPGKRQAKTREQDLKEAIASIEAELLMMEQAE